MAVEGNNKVTASNSSATYSCTFNELPVYYGVSNLGSTTNVDANNKTYPSTKKDSITKTSTSVSASETTGKTTPGAYKYFLGYGDYTAIDQLDSAKVRALTTKSGWITKDGTTTIVDNSGNNNLKSNGKSIVIACPSKYKLSSVSNGVGADILVNFTTKGVQGTRTVKLAGGEGADHTYNVYIYPITNGAEVEFKNVTLVKA